MAASTIPERKLSVATALLLVNICITILGPSAQAQTPRDPKANVLTAPEPRDTGADSKSKVVCTQDRSRRARQEIDRAIHARLEILYPDQCRELGGQTFDLRKEEIRLQGNAASISYVLVLFETCEEGAPYEASRHKEKWVRTTKGWEPVEDDARLVPNN
jgi:hypothetical protein